MKETWKLFSGYLLILLFLLFSQGAFAQVQVIQFNAEWNAVNKVEWCTSKKLSDCEVSFIDIGKNTKAQNKYKVVVVPTIIILDEGEEVKRFQADISFKFSATREEVQEAIDEIIMNKF